MLLAMAVMMAMMVANAGMASAVAIANGKGGEMANERAAFGIGVAAYNTATKGGGGCGGACE